jgi:hypothetical protein
VDSRLGHYGLTSISMLQSGRRGWLRVVEIHGIAADSEAREEEEGTVTPTFYKNKNFVPIGVHIKMHIKL